MTGTDHYRIAKGSIIKQQWDRVTEIRLSSINIYSSIYNMSLNGHVLSTCVHASTFPLILTKL